MSQKFVIDKIWLQDYLGRLRSQRQLLQKLLFNMNKVKLTSQPTEWIQFDEVIRRIYQLKEEMGVMIETLEQLLQCEEVTARQLSREMKEIEERLRSLL